MDTGRSSQPKKSVSGEVGEDSAEITEYNDCYRGISIPAIATLQFASVLTVLIHTCSKNHSTMTKLPPGVNYLIHCIPQLLIGPVSTLLLLKLFQTFYSSTFQLSIWVTIILLILSGPVIFTISLAWNDFKNYRAARAIGAVLPPQILDYSPGNIYSIWKEIKHEKTGYFGEILFFFFPFFSFLFSFATECSFTQVIYLCQVMDFMLKQRILEVFHSI